MARRSAARVDILERTFLSWRRTRLSGREARRAGENSAKLHFPGKRLNRGKTSNVQPSTGTGGRSLDVGCSMLDVGCSPRSLRRQMQVVLAEQLPEGAAVLVGRFGRARDVAL